MSKNSLENVMETNRRFDIPRNIGCVASFHSVVRG